MPDASAEGLALAHTRAAGWRQTAVLSAILVAACLLTGRALVHAPWLPGDEYIFIADNPDVTEAGRHSLADLLVRIFRFPPDEDLYQPLPILTYAIQWAVWGDCPFAVRLTDVLIHAVNALLLWRVISRLSAHSACCLTASAWHMRASWLAALLWAVHPVNAHAWAADMGRTHILAATFALLAIAAQLRAIETQRSGWFVGAAAALLCVMLCKVMPLWFVLALAVQAAWCGWRATVRSAWPYVAGAICLAFAAAAWWTSVRSGLIEDASAGLFGDPVARSALAVYLYARNFLLPLWLSPWYLPDPQTGWHNPRVWIGLVIAASSILAALWAWRKPIRRPIALGWIWFWSLLSPVVGLIGAREAAAVDRYLYQPLMGLALAVAAGLILATSPQYARLGRPVLLAGSLTAACLALVTCSMVSTYRAPIARARRIAALYPGDPRALEALAAAYHFASAHRVPDEDLALVPPREQPRLWFLRMRLETLRSAAQTPDLGRYFPGPQDLAPFHRRLSAAFADLGAFDAALGEAEAAARLEPDHFRTWVRLAHAYVGLGRFEQAVDAFERCEALLPDDPLTQATHYTNFGRLLLFDMERADLAYPKFLKAVRLKGELAPRYRRALRIADIGLARCEIRVGQGARGYALIMRVLDENPQDALAGLVLAEYHLRSHHWDQARVVYETLIAAYPTVYSRLDWYYEALRGFDSVCAQTGRWQDAVVAWDHAVRHHPDSREFRSFRAWASACAGDAQADEFTRELLAEEPDNQLGCLARMLLLLRAGRVDEAVEWVQRAATGQAVPKSRAFERAVATLRLMSADNSLPASTSIVEAAVYLAVGQRELAADTLDQYRRSGADGQWAELVDRLLAAAAAGGGQAPSQLPTSSTPADEE